MYSVAVSIMHRVVIRGIIMTIARFLGVEPNHKDQVFVSEWFDQAAFALMKFCNVEFGRFCGIYPGDRLLPLLNVDQTTLLHWSNLRWVPNDAKVIQPAYLPPPLTSYTRLSSSSQPTPL